MKLNTQKRIPQKMAEVMGDEILPTHTIYDRLRYALAYVRKGRTKRWRNIPTKQQVSSILGSGLFPQFVRMTEKGKSPAYWAYVGEEE